jgi:4-carboxymuconolactone decarboxylase
MTRVPMLTEADLSAEQKKFYAQIKAKRDHVAPPFAALLHTPELAAQVASIGEMLRYVSPSISSTVREVVTLTVAKNLNCQYIWTHHVESALQAGLDDTTIAIIRDQTATNSTSNKIQIFIDFTNQLLLQKRISQETYVKVEDTLGRKGTVDLILMIGYYATLSYAINALEIQLEEGIIPLLPE